MNHFIVYSNKDQPEKLWITTTELEKQFLTYLKINGEKKSEFKRQEIKVPVASHIEVLTSYTGHEEFHLKAI